MSIQIAAYPKATLGENALQRRPATLLAARLPKL